MSKKKIVSPSITPGQQRNKHIKKSSPVVQAKQNKPVAFVILAVVIFIIFYPSLKGEFTNWDDGTYVMVNPMIWELNSKTIKEIFTEPVSLNYHPLTMLSLAIDYKIGKLNPYYYHFTNIIIHILNTLLLFVFIQKLIDRYNRVITGNKVRPDSFFMALVISVFWAIHPMRVESVTWIAERKDVLYVFFFFLSLIFYLEWLDNKKKSKAILCFLFFVLSCLSKGMAVVLPVVLILIDWLYDNIKTIKQFVQSVITKAHFFVGALVFGILAFKIQSRGAIAAMETFNPMQRITFGCYGFIMYIWKLFLPVNLSAFYPYPFTDTQGNIPAIYYASPFIVLAIAGIITFIFFKNREAGKVLVFGFLFYFVTIVLVLQFLSVGSAIMADRYSYLSYVGLLFIAAYYIGYIKQKLTKEYMVILWGILIIILGALSYLTRERTKVWTNAATLWTDAINQFPFIEIAYENRGIYYKDHNELDKMLKDYEFLTQTLHTRNEKIWTNLGNLYGLLKQYDKSLNAYSTAIEIDPHNASTYLNRAITYSMMGEYQKSLPDYDQSILLDSMTALTYKNRAYTLMQVGQFDKSIHDYDKAILLFPYDTASYLNRGISKYNAKKYTEALTDFKKYITLIPNNAQAYYNASVAASNANLYTEALKYAEQAQKLGQQISPQYMEDLKSKTKLKG